MKKPLTFLIGAAVFGLVAAGSTNNAQAGGISIGINLGACPPPPPPVVYYPAPRTVIHLPALPPVFFPAPVHVHVGHRHPPGHFHKAWRHDWKHHPHHGFHNPHRHGHGYSRGHGHGHGHGNHDGHHRGHGRGGR